MQREWIVACLVVWNTTAAQLAPSTVASVNSCLGAELSSDGCFDRFRLRLFDGRPLSVNATLGSPAVHAQLEISSTTEASYGFLRAGTSSTLDVSEHPMPASSNAEAGFTDVITISYAPLNGQPGLLYVNYRLSGSVSSPAQNTSFSETQVFAGTSLEQRYSVRHSSSTWGLFSLPQPIRFTYGAPFGFKFVLVTTNGFRPGDEAGTGMGFRDGLVDALVLSGLRPKDQFGNPVDRAQFTSASGTQYGSNGVARDSGPAPTDQPPTISSLRPSSGPPGTLITVTGSGFTPTSGGVMYTPGAVDNSGNTVQLGADISLKNLNSVDGVTVQFQLPRNVPPGMYSVTIVNENGTSNTVLLTITPN